MQAVAAAQLQPVMGSDADSLKQGQQLIAQTAAVHNSRLAAGATPRHYVAFVHLCSKLYTTKRDELIEQQKFLKVTNPSMMQASRPSAVETIHVAQSCTSLLVCLRHSPTPSAVIRDELGHLQCASVIRTLLCGTVAMVRVV